MRSPVVVASSGRRRGRREGSALIIVMVMIMSIMVLALTMSQDAVMRSRAVSAETDAARALWAAEAGIGLAVNQLAAASGSLADGSQTITLDQGAACTVAWTKEGQYYRIRADATVADVQRSVEVYVTSQNHPLFYKATYVANEEVLPDGTVRRLVKDYRLTFGPSKLVQGGAPFDENERLRGSRRLSELDHQVDFNNDGVLNASPTIAEIYTNRVAWGWDGHVKKDGRDYQLNINKDMTRGPGGRLVADYSDRVTAPTVEVATTPRDPSSDSPPTETQVNWAGMAKSNDSDYIEGNVYVNGDVAILGGTDVFGDVDAARREDPDVDEAQWDTGEVIGAPVSGNTTNNSSYISPPDLSNPTGDGVTTYEDIADVVVEGNQHLPGFIRPERTASTYGNDLGPEGSHDNPHYHLQNGSSPTLSFGHSLDGGLVLVKGNLWIHDTSSFTISMPRGSKEQVTIVVEGNLYIADDLEYNNDQNALLFIVKGKDDNPESYIDENRNYKYDPGEKILHDDGDGVYEGPIEGQGNVFFGDPRFGTGGVTDGYIYAQNNVYLVNPPRNVQPPSNAQDQIFGVYGFLSAGGIVDLGDRTGGSTYNNFRVKYDPRLENGTVKFKGMPKAMGGGWQGMAVVSWREVVD